MSQTNSLPSNADRIQRNALVVGIVGLIATVAGFFIDPEQFFQSYLLGYTFWLQLALGGIGLLMIHHLTGGYWAFAIRRPLEACAMTVLVMAVLFIPILLGMGELYHWTDPEVVAESPLLQHKEPYLNVPFFLVRVVIYFIVWIGLAYLLNKWSRDQDNNGDPQINTRFKRLSALGMILFMLTGTFAAYDWLMSLEPEWFSSIYGVIYLSGSALATVAFGLFVSRRLRRQEPIANWLPIDIFNDLGNFMLAFVSFWAYVSFSQFLIIWMANLPEEITWYIRRTQGGWQYVGAALIFLGFALPFTMLLSRKVKRSLGILIPLAVFVFLVRYIDLFWHIMPAFYETFHIHWLDFATPIGIGGIWVAFFISQLKRKPLVAMHDPRFQEVPAHG